MGWKGLHHPNIILPLYGVDLNPSTLSIVYDWCENGHITEYLSSHPKEPKEPLVCKFMLLEPQDVCTNLIFPTHNE